MSTARYASSTWAIIPVKPLRESKTRLSCIMSAAQRAELVLNFLQHNLHVLRQVSAIDRILVISSDPEILQYARQHGALTLDEEQPHGLNVAVLRAVHYAAAKRATAALILPVDLPLM